VDKVTELPAVFSNVNTQFDKSVTLAIVGAVGAAVQRYNL
jgi:hypothetical protein